MASQLLRLFNQAQREEISCGINHINVCTGMRLRYIEKNHSGAATLLLLHDLAEQSTVFIKIAQELAEAGFRVLAIDQRGHGKSSSPTDKAGAYSLDWLIEDVKGFILALNLYSRPVIMLGKGLGGIVASHFASRYPKLVGCLIVLDPIHENCESLGHFPGQDAIFPSVESACLFGLEHFDRWKCRYPIQAYKTIVRLLREKKDHYGFEYLIDKDWQYTTSSDCTDKAQQCSIGYIQNIQVELPTLVLGPEKSSILSEIENHGKGHIRVERLLSLTFGLEEGTTIVSLSSVMASFLLDYKSHFDLRDTSTRLPERLGLSVLRSFASLDEAVKALGPRKIPSDSAIELELAKLREEDGGAESDDDSDARVSFKNRTALIKEDPEYFGFLG